jgi:hypothetical protein
MAPTIRAQTREYWTASRSHRYSLVFAMPLLLLYELLEALSPVRASGGIVRNGADVLLTGVFSWMLGPRGPLVFMALVIGGALWLIVRDRSGGPFRVSTLGAMLGESLVLALLFGLVVGTATVHLVGPLRSLSAGGALNGGPLARLTLSLGAGLYEELLFRVGLSRIVAGTLAVIAGALLFSAFHYVGPFGEPMRLESFVFRTLAGLAFSALYLTRGFGITAWTHALYDVAVLF